MNIYIRNALIVDGSGGPARRGDLAVSGGRLVHPDQIRGAVSRTIDATGLVAVPGFIDMHSHADLEYLQPEPRDQKIRQGITTELIGQDGLGTAPASRENAALVAQLAGGLQGTVAPERWTWQSFGEYLEALERRGLPTNAAVLVSHGPVRVEAMDMASRTASADDLRRMQQAVRQAMQEGAFGFSTGLIYPPCSYSDTQELVEVCRVVSELGGLFVVHTRDEAWRLRESFAEMEQVVRASGVRLHISHLQAFGPPCWPFMDDVLRGAEALIAEGYPVTWDRYPYLAGCTVLTAVLPGWALADGPAALVENLKRPDFRQRLHLEFKKGLEVWSNRAVLLGWSKVSISSVGSEKNRWMVGSDIASLSAQQGKDPVDFICDLLLEENLDVRMISHYGSDEVLEKVLDHPGATFGTDGIPGGRPHPRLYGAAPRFLQTFVKEKQSLSLPEAVRKATGFPASVLGLDDRGLVQEGYWADIVLLDLDALADRATYAEPDQYPAGIEYVFVNGDLAVEQGRFTGRLAGQVLRKRTARSDH